MYIKASLKIIDFIISMLYAGSGVVFGACLIDHVTIMEALSNPLVWILAKRTV